MGQSPDKDLGALRHVLLLPIKDTSITGLEINLADNRQEFGIVDMSAPSIGMAERDGACLVEDVVRDEGTQCFTLKDWRNWRIPPSRRVLALGWRPSARRKLACVSTRVPLSST
jgi:hypothetical protein